MSNRIPAPIEIKWTEYTWEQIGKDYPRLARTINDRFPHMFDYDKSDIAAIAMNVCHSCHNNDSKCQCWNDE